MNIEEDFTIAETAELLHEWIDNQRLMGKEITVQITTEGGGLTASATLTDIDGTSYTGHGWLWWHAIADALVQIHPEWKAEE